MDKRKIANQQVKDKLLSALVTLLQQKEWSKITITELVESPEAMADEFLRLANHSVL